MIQLDTGQTLSAVAGTNNVINVTLSPDLITTSDSFAPVQARIPSPVGTLYTSTGGQTNIPYMKLVNTTALDVTGVQFFIIGTNATTNPITAPFTMPASTYAVYAQGRITIYAAVTGLPISSNAVVSVTAADGSITVGGTTQAPTVSRAALTGDVTAPAGSNATTIKNDVALGGNPTTTTQSANNNSTRVATTAYVDTADALKAPLASPGLTGNPTAPTQSSSDNSTRIASTAFVATAIANGVAGLLDYRGSYDASTNLFPATNGSGIAGAILKGDFYICSIAGTLGGTAVSPGDLIIALTDTPAQTASNWDIIEHDLGYAPENAANKSTDGAMTANSTTLYPSQSAVVTYAQPKDSDLTAIALLTTTSYGRALLTLTNSAALTAAVDAATTTLPGLLPAADKTSINNSRKFRVNALDYGADPTNATSSATALTNAIAALPNGGIIEFPPGTYNFGNVPFSISTAHITIQGAARYNTVFTTTNTADSRILVRNQYYITIQDITATGAGSGQNPTAVAGALIACNNANSAYGVIRRVSTTYAYDCIDISDTLSITDETETRFFKHSGIVVNQNSDHQIEQATMDNNTSFLPTGGGIDVSLTASLLVNSCNIIHSNNALNLNASAGVTIPSVKGVNNFFDTSAVGLNISGGGSVLRCEFTNSWFSSMSTAGISLTPSAGGQVDGITFVNCDIYNNVAGTTVGVQTNAQTKKWKMLGCSIAGWTTGINLVAGASHYATIECNTIGSVSAFGVNTTGIAIGAGAYLGLVIISNDAANNTTPITIAATPTFSDYKQFRILSNPGINTGGAQTPPAATPVLTTVYQNTFGYPMLVVVKHGATANTSITINGSANTLGFVAAQVATYRLEPGDTWAVAGGTAPTVWAWNKQ
jgi:hypothetical protein